MTDDEIVFEEPPIKTRKSEHFPLLLAVKERPGTYARVKVGLEEKDANYLANSVRTAASKLGDGFEVIARYIPETGKHGVWARYTATAGDDPPEAARAMVKEAMEVPPDGKLSPPISGDGAGQVLSPFSEAERQADVITQTGA